MTRNVYYVVSHQGEWKISFEQRHIGVYLTQKDAIRTAVDMAHGDGRKGQDAEVRVQGTDGQFRTEWTYGHDPYPPRG